MTKKPWASYRRRGGPTRRWNRRRDHVGTPRLNADVRRLERDRVVSERICWAVITALHGERRPLTQTFNLGPPAIRRRSALKSRTP